MNIAAAQPDARPREAELLSVATRLFRERGYHATSMQDLAEALGMNRGSLYHYIRSKEELLARLFEGALAETLGELERIADREGPARERLRDMVRVYVMAVTANLDAVALYLREWRALPPPHLARVPQHLDDTGMGDHDNAGTKVSAEILKADEDTVFPLLPAMGVEM